MALTEHDILCLMHQNDASRTIQSLKLTSPQAPVRQVAAGQAVDWQCFKEAGFFKVSHFLS